MYSKPVKPEGIHKQHIGRNCTPIGLVFDKFDKTFRPLIWNLQDMVAMPYRVMASMGIVPCGSFFDTPTHYGHISSLKRKKLSASWCLVDKL